MSLCLLCLLVAINPVEAAVEERQTTVKSSVYLVYSVVQFPMVGNAAGAEGFNRKERKENQTLNTERRLTILVMRFYHSNV